MAISVKFVRESSAATANTFVVTAGSGDTGKLQIQYNDADIYNNLSGSTNDILSGASNTTINIPLDSNNEIPKGYYYFNFQVSAGDSAESTVDFEFDMRSPVLTSTVDLYAPSFRVDDDTSYTATNATISAISRTATSYYPEGSNQSNISATSSASAASLYLTTTNLWSGAMQTVLTYDVTYSVPATTIGFTTYAAYTYQEKGIGYDTENIDADNALSDVYNCIESLRRQVVEAQTKNRANYETLRAKYTYAGALSIQFREAVTNNKTEALDDIITQIKNLTDCNASSSNNPSTQSIKIYGINGARTELINDSNPQLGANLDTNGYNITGNPEVNSRRPVVNLSASSLTLGSAHAGARIVSNYGSATTIIIPPDSTYDFENGTEIKILQRGVGTVTVSADAAVDLNGTAESTAASSGQYKSLFLFKYGNDDWYITGDLA